MDHLVWLHADLVRYSQDSISSSFTDGTPIACVYDMVLRTGLPVPSRHLQLQVVLLDGIWFALNNRTFFLLQLLARHFGWLLPVCIRTLDAHHSMIRRRLHSPSRLLPGFEMGRDIRVRARLKGPTWAAQLRLRLSCRHAVTAVNMCAPSTDILRLLPISTAEVWIKPTTIPRGPRHLWAVACWDPRPTHSGAPFPRSRHMYYQAIINHFAEALGLHTTLPLSAEVACVSPFS